MALYCKRCEKEIKPGDHIEFVGADPEARILVESDALIVHAECPA